MRQADSSCRILGSFDGREEIVRSKRDTSQNRSFKKLNLHFRWNSTTSPAPILGVSPATNAILAAADHISDHFRTTADFYDCMSWVQHDANRCDYRTNSQSKRCDYRQYASVAISATKLVMEKIDRHWIRERLALMPRGSQARLAEHLGIPSNTMSKIMNGVRDIQQDEVPKVLTFFNARIVTSDQLDEDLTTLLRGASKLNNDGLRLLKKQLNEILQIPALVQRSESSPQEGEPDEG